MMNKKIKKISANLLLIVIIQIFLLINMGPANNYIIHQADKNVLSKNENKNTAINVLTKTAITLIKKFFSVKQIGIVSAGEAVWNCCPKTKLRAICQDLGIDFVNDCAVNTIPTKCEQNAECKQGCCIDEKEGLCATKSTKKQCEDDGGLWKDEENCLIEECVKGCCVLGNQAQFVTEKRCEKISLEIGFNKDFRRGKTEIDCIALGASQIDGACVFRNESCSRKTEAECLSKGGQFFKDYLCSHPDIINLGVSCEKQTSIGCGDVEKQEYGIYWFDSCGNMENIYDSDKDESWNNGKILNKENSCNSNSNNINSETCGNCNYYLGSKCAPSSEVGGKKVKDGDYICKDLRCVDEKGKTRENGESWCVYDSYIGDGKDTVGSRHWRRMCIDGEIKVEPCADYRGQICAQSVIEEGSKKFSLASCVVNEAVMCLNYNSANGPTEECTKNKDCMIKNIHIGDNFKFDICVGRYPRGFDLTGEEKYETSSQLCKMADQECKIMYQKDWKGKWKCKTNCECKERKFAEQLNDLCISLGDCGTYINYIGEGTDNIRVDGAPSVSWTEYTKYAQPVDGQFAEPKDLMGLLGQIFGLSAGIDEIGESGLANAVNALGTISGAAGAIAYYGAGYIAAALGPTGASSIAAYTISSSFGGAAIGTAIGMFVASTIGKWLGIQGDAALAFSIAGGVAGGVMGYSYLAYGKLIGTATIGWTVVVAVLVMLYIWLIGWGKIKTETIKFTCMPWQAPTGGKDCSKCNVDSLKPCTEYRCTSLGQACKLLNEDTENPICESIQYESNPPVITPGRILKINASELNEIILASEIIEDPYYAFTNEETKRVEIRAVDGDGCIPEFTLVPFTLDTDEYAQCKFDLQKTAPNYDEMALNYPAEQTRFTINHTFGIFMPSLDALEVYNVTGDLRKMFGNMNMYVRCQDYHGNFNLDEYIVNFCVRTGPDLTPARINYYNPLDNSYLKYGTAEIPAAIYLNEPAECKYDIVSGKSYDLMSNTMACETDVFTPGLYGWQCNTTFTNLIVGENKFYIKCKDQPWLPAENNSQRNINTDDFVYALQVSEFELEIDSIAPDGTIEAGFEPISIDLEVKTSGGAKDGEATCYYSFLSYIDMIQFFNTFSDEHKQNFNMMMRGDYVIYIKCEDEAGNIATGETKFKLEVDSSPPIITRIYKEGNYLKLLTNEEAECFYDFNRCSFDISNASSMTTGYSKSHTSEWVAGKTYHVRCIDIWGNFADGCSIKVSPSYFG